MRLKGKIRSLEESQLLPADLDIHFNGLLNAPIQELGLVRFTGFLLAQSLYSQSKEMVAIVCIKNALPELLCLLSILTTGSGTTYYQNTTALTAERIVCWAKRGTVVSAIF